MSTREKVNILLVDDQPGKLLSYEVILKDLDENLIKARSAREALGFLLKTDVAVILIDVVMPDLDGFQLASMIHDHPRFQKTAIIFISAVQVTDVDRLRGYEIGGVDYVPVPVIPAVLRAKVRVFVDLYRKTRELERLNRELEQRVDERTAELRASTAHLQQSEKRRTLALAAGQMGSWDWDLVTNDCTWDEGQFRICGLDPSEGTTTHERLDALLHPDDREPWKQALRTTAAQGTSCTIEFRVIRPSGEMRWCIATAAATLDGNGNAVHISGVTIDITERKEAEERQALLAREVDHRSRNALAVVQSIMRLSRAEHIKEFVRAVDGRIQALSIAHTLLSQSRWKGADLARIIDEELAPFRAAGHARISVSGPNLLLRPASAQAIALALHELVTNAAKYGALSTASGQIALRWRLEGDAMIVEWVESGGPPVSPPTAPGFGSTMIAANVESGLDGRLTLDWRPEGLRCTFVIPRSNLARSDDRAMPDASSRPAIVAAPHAMPTVPRILVVEDESLIAMMMKDVLTDLGYEVIGPYARNDDALTAIDQQHVAGAMLDLNVNGETVYPVAEALASRHIPFILVTGYDSQSIDRRFENVPTLQKPIEAKSLEHLLRAMIKVHAPLSSRVASETSASRAVS
jgi:PAS domain S-box-containing protein